MFPLEQKILNLLGQRQKTSLGRREISARLNLHGGERKLLTKVLNQLVRGGQLEERKGRYRGTRQKTVAGVLSLADKGYGFLRLDDEQQEDLFIPERSINTAMDGDRVLVSSHVSHRDKRSYGKIVKVLQRAHQRLIGHYQQRGKGGEVWPLDQKLGRAVQVGKHPEIPSGNVVEVEIDRYASTVLPARGRIVEQLGAADNPQVDIETVIRSYDLPQVFSPATEVQTETIETAIPDAEIVRRTDLRNLPLITIDGATAKDFDDAVALRKEADGSFRLWVCIADVAHYVETDSALDQDALDRGTSVYFPGFCLPMLPEALSNGICSLNPHEDRLVMTAEMHIDQNGVPLESKFYPAVIRSQARLTYVQVDGFLTNPETAELDNSLVEQLLEMAELAKILTRMRHQRGSLDMDLPEVEILLDEQGRPVDLVKIERTQSHRLIEEFMLAANEATARFLRDKGWSFLYRIHEEPDPLKLQELQQLAAECGIGLVLDKNPQKSLQKLLSDAVGRPEERLINQQLLRSLQRARYSPLNSGHFGLAAESYCHFTSPIRRYPDLIVHRVLKLALAGSPKSASVSDGRLETLSRECSAKEQRATEAERSLVDLRSCQVLSGRIGEEFSGTISSVTEFGFFVELDDLYVDGLVHIRTLQDDYFHFDPTTLTLTGERRHQSYRIGMRIKVRLKKVELWRRRIDFVLAEDQPSGT
ncbi:MAG: ribonuclease R [Thermodesulfobacteriota bacterium]|nr:ribonuclease R [Thermodesulfobacteriota bacterium]